jgi:transcriptional regulator with XRE-family HTH domain
MPLDERAVKLPVSDGFTRAVFHATLAADMARSRKKAIPLRTLDAKRVRHHRLAHKWTREDLAAYMRAVGFRWTDHTVANIENNVRELSRGEWLKLLQMFGGERGFYGEDAPPLELPSPGSVSHVGIIEEIVSGGDPPPTEPIEAELRRWRERADPERAEADRKAARALGIGVVELKKAARRLWTRSLVRERERRLNGRLRNRGEVSARSRQAMRAHVTRELLAELRGAGVGKKSSRRRSK